MIQLIDKDQEELKYLTELTELLKKQDINCIICTSNKECISLFENVQDIFYAPIYNIFAWVRFFIHHQVTIWHSFNHNKLKPWQSGIRFLVQYITKSKPILVRKKVSCQSASELVDYYLKESAKV